MTAALASLTPVRVLRRAAVVVGTGLLLTASTASAGAGDFDRSFGVSGRVTTSVPSGLSDFFGDLVRQPEGGYTTLGAFGRGRPGDPSGDVFLRHNADGTLDRSFGTGGRLIEDPLATSLAVQPDGRLLTAGRSAEGGFGLTRRLADGSLDPSFGGDGRVTTAFADGRGIADSVTLLPDGRLVATGRVTLPPAEPGGTTGLAAARYLADGSLDESFGRGGRLIASSLPRGDIEVIDPSIQADGKIVALVGYVSGGRLTEVVDVFRFNTDGSRDQDFGTRGSARITGAEKVGGALLVQPDGKLLVAGQQLARPEGLLLARLLPDGSPDRTFGGGDGQLVERFAGSPAGISDGTSMVLDRRGRILVGGPPLDYDDGFVVGRFTARGQLDRSFGQGGTVSTEFGNRRARLFDRARVLDLVAQPDGRLVAAGAIAHASEGNDQPSSIGLARYHGDRFGSLGRLARTGSLQAVRKSGLRLPIRCTQACTAQVALRLSPTLARRLGVPKVVGRASVRLERPGASLVRVRLRPKGGQGLRRVRRALLEVSVRFSANGRSAERTGRRVMLNSSGKR